ncbi:MAG TPA: aldehyde dehydrogenase family protein [Polyangia bacterium]|nr:aldehyde dehydrogenase family protein [Polyangia bacterium]
MNPATLAVIRELPCQNPDDLAKAVQRARAAQPAWASLSLTDRRRGLRRLTRRLLADPEAMDTLVAESGKPRYQAELIELFYTCELTRFYTGRVGRRALRDDLRHPLIFVNKRARVVYHPRGQLTFPYRSRTLRFVRWLMRRLYG